MKLLIKQALIRSMEQAPFVGDLLIDGKKISKIAPEIKADEDTKVLDAANLLLTPGLIDGHCHTGILEESIGKVGNDVNEVSDPVVPHMRAIDGINPMVPEFHDAREGGVTMAMIGPGSLNVIGGQFTLLKTAGKRIDKMIVKSPAAMKIAFGENPKGFYGALNKSPSTRMGTAAMLREALYQAKQYYEEKEQGENPAFNMKWEAMLPVFRKEIPLKAHAHQADDIFTAIRIAKEFDLPMTIDHCTEGHLIADELAEEGYPIFLGPTFGGKTKYELRNTSFDTARVLYEAGIPFAIVTDAYIIPLKHLSLCAALAIQAGLPEEEGWRTITETPAKFLGVYDRAGSLAAGKDADMVLFRGNPLLETSAKTVLTIIDGQIVYSDGSIWEG